MDGENNEPAQQDQAQMDSQQQPEEGNVPAQDTNMEGAMEDFEQMDGDEQMDEGADMGGMEGADQLAMDQFEDQQAAVEQEQEQVDVTRDARVQWMCKYVEDLVNFDASAPTCQLNNDRLQPYYNFLERADYTRFFVWCDFETGELTYSFERAPAFYESDVTIKTEDYQVVYFIKRNPSQETTSENVAENLIAGTCERDPLDSLLDMMNESCPKLLGENDWPENVKKEFVSNLHNFMAVITEASYTAKGMTNLYIPNEDLTDIDTAIKDKDLLQRLESIVIYWTRQIKELVSNQDSQTSHDNSSPLDEIKHWVDRTSNLKVLTTRLKEPKLTKIITVLERFGSSYLGGFLDLKSKIQESYDEAEANLKFLKTLEDPCRKIEKAEPKEIPKLLPDVLNSVRIIWELSDTYATDERMKGLLTKISNQINQRCRKKINKEDMLGNDVEKCMRDLDESIECCKQWKDICTKMQRRIKVHSTKKDWKLDTDETIFAENEAFIQRCRDLKEICEGQLQFALKGSNVRMPEFGGTKGKEWKVSLSELGQMFSNQLEGIKKLEYDILDVKITRWHDDYGQMFKDHVKNIEIIYQTIIAKTFQHVSTIADAVEMLENFFQLAKRPSIIDYVQKKAADQVYKMFMEEIKEVEDMFEGRTKKRPPMPISNPHFGGLAIWANSLIVRIDKARDAIEGMYFVPNHPAKEEAFQKYQKVKLNIDNYIQQRLSQDFMKENTLLNNEQEINACLEDKILYKLTDEDVKAENQLIKKNTLFAKSSKVGLLQSNFNVEFLRTLVEIQYWNKVEQNNLPGNITRLVQKREQLRLMMENVLLIVRDYNHIMNLISDFEKKLFSEHLQELDKTIRPGILRITWNNNAESFAMSCRNSCNMTLKKIKIYQERDGLIHDEFDKVQSTILTNIRKTLYKLPQFMEQQSEELKKKEVLFKDSFEKVRKLMISTYQDLFMDHGREIQEIWLKHLDGEYDKKLLNALKNSVKSTLIDFLHHIKGDEQEIVPIFKVYSTLNTKTEDWKVLNEPSHDVLLSSTEKLLKSILKVTAVVPRIQGVFRKDRQAILDDWQKKIRDSDGASTVPPEVTSLITKIYGSAYNNMSIDERKVIWDKKFELPKQHGGSAGYIDKISESNPKKNEKDVKNTMDQIIEVVKNIYQKMTEDCKHLQLSHEVRQLMAMKTVRGTKRFLRGNQSSDQNDDTVLKYRNGIVQLREIVTDIKGRQSTKNMEFIVIHYSKLKNDLIDQGNTFIQQIFSHLVSESKKDLYTFLEELSETVDELKKTCQNKEQLKRNREKEREVRSRMAQLQGRIDPIKRKFEFIQDDSFSDIGNVELTEQDKSSLAGLDHAWKQFTLGMNEAKQNIQKAYQDFKAIMEEEIDDFKRQVTENRENFKRNAPFSVSKEFEENNNMKAFEMIQHFSKECEKLREQEEQMHFGLEIFEIEGMQYGDLKLVEKENSALLAIWSIKQEWDQEWDCWRDILFKDLDLRHMDDRASDIIYKIQALPKEEKKWKVTEFINDKISVFMNTTPLINDLRDESMRDRHWKELRIEVKEDFDEHSADFTLEKVFQLNLIQHADKISDLTSNAKKQLKIEKGLKEIKRMWESDPATNLTIEVVVSKATQDQCYKIGDTGNIYTLIEEHSAELATMKASPYYKQFDDKIDAWEQNIAKITDTLEMLTTVQQNWSYLESIFGGQADIGKQMAREENTFKNVDAELKIEMERIQQKPNAFKSLVEDVRDFVQKLTKLNDSLERVQKNLQQWLQSKRNQFPRFFFLSNDDLLEIIGNSQDKDKINKNIKKIFEGINTLELDTVNAGKGQATLQARAAKSAELETLNLVEPLIEVTPQVQDWLKQLTRNVEDALKKEFYTFSQGAAVQSKKIFQEKDKLSEVVRKNLGQVLLTYAQIQWTKDVKEHLESYAAMAPGSPNTPLKKLKSVYKRKIETYIQCVERLKGDKLEHKIDRLKIVALIIMEEHNREVIDKLYQNKNINPGHFEWLSQLRFEREPDQGSEHMSITCEQLSARFPYGYEYQGNNGRLVITPLTDRAYMTLTNALDMQRGGAPQGPAGTGKTETVKDLGKGLAYYVVIQNCSDQMDHNSMGTIFAGLAQCGCWGCFDEFNRITLDVLSVITTMVQDILDAIRRGSGPPVNIGDNPSFNPNPNTGLFITMNPGYAGRSELPDNLQALFRPVAMMAPDFQAICKIILMSEGFQKNEELAKKITTVFDLMKRQLSKQSHYDFSMRAIKSVLNSAGRIKRETPGLEEIKIVLKAIRDMNLPKFLAEDVVLFDNLFMDLFPEVEEPEVDTDALQIAIEQSLLKRGLQLDENLVVKIMQLYESKVTRHGNMLVGATMSGKTVCWQILSDALNRLHVEEAEERKVKGGSGSEQKWQKVSFEVVNPKSISEKELYGDFDDQSPPQWQEGVLASVLTKMVGQELSVNRWLILDGPVDTLWIESMNSVLDDSKRLTLINCDVIALTPNVRLLFEVENLTVASPATVSRAGMIYLDIEELGWRPILKSWLDTKKEQGQEYYENLLDVANRYLDKILTAKKLSCNELVKSSESACVKNCCKLFDSLTGMYSRGEMAQDDWNLYVEKWFVFSMIWSIGATVDEGSRRELDVILRDIEPMFPTTNTVFEYYISPDKKDWSQWEDKLKTQPLGNKEFHEIYIQTVDWARNRYVSQALLNAGSQVLFVGNSGVGKTVLIEKTLLSELQAMELHFTINFSAGTTSKGCQEVIESNFDRRIQGKFKPKNSKIKAICFIDDLNMPRKDNFGSQPPIELLRQWIDYGFWYDRQKVSKNYMCDFQILAAMGKPGGGRAELSNRIVSKMHLINFTVPTESQMRRIYETMAQAKFQQFYEEIKELVEPLTIATITLFHQISETFLPTPAKSHYVFNMRDISKVFQGLYLADKNFYESKEQIIKLWGHEILRVFHDRLINTEDQNLLKRLLNDQLEQHFSVNYQESCMTNETSDAVFVDFLIGADDDDDKRVYEEVSDFQRLREYLNEKLVSYNQQKRVQKMDIVLFTDAIIHISKIYRVINLKRGHALLVGVGGSGRHSLTRLAAYISNMNVDQLEIRKDFNLRAFRTKLKELYELAAFNGARNPAAVKLKTVFIFSDNDVIEESFLEDIQNMLNGGIVPNIYPADELQRVRDEMKSILKKQLTIDNPDQLNEFFFNRVKDNMHLSICMSPIGKRFRNYTRNYPALINNTAIDWFMAWPEEALIEVAQKYISRIDVPEELKGQLSALCGYSFQTTTDAAIKMERELKRIFYVTPTNFIELLKGYSKILNQKKKEIGGQISKLRNGLDKLQEAAEEVQKMTQESEVKRAEVSKKSQECQDLKMDLAKQENAANEKQKEIVIKTESVNKERVIAMRLADEANTDLAKAMPALQAADEAVQSLDKKSLNELKAYNTPPKDIQMVMASVMTLLDKPTEWPAIKSQMANPKFLDWFFELDRDNIPDARMKKVEVYTKKEIYMPSYLSRKSVVAGSLAFWVRSIEDYHKALKVVRPKIAKRDAAAASLAALEAQLKKMQDEYEILAKMLKELQDQLSVNTQEMETYKADLDQLQAKIERGDKLITGLSGEKIRWEASLVDLDEQFINLTGNAMLAASFMSLCGPFPSDYREDLGSCWLKKIKALKIPFKTGFEFCDFLASKAMTRRWQLDGLPQDTFSTENGVLITKGLRWALSIDPQTQANGWIKKMCGKHLIILDLNDGKYMKKLEQCLAKGSTVLLQDVGEELDPSLDNLLNKATFKSGGELCVKLGEKEVPYNKDFQLYITTRVSNPHYTPEVSTKVNVINFSIKEVGLEEQCLGIVVQEEQPNLEQHKNQLVEKIEGGNQKLLELEDEILRRLNESNVNLLENIGLIKNLEDSKDTSDNVKQGIESATSGMKKINETRDTFRECGRIAAALFFVLNDLHKINPMYQFSLNWYRDLFKTSIRSAKDQTTQQQDKINNIIKIHILNVYRQTCKSLFERHKLLLAFNLCVKLQMSNGLIDPDEFTFFLRGGVSMGDNKGALPKPPGQDWITQNAWDNIIELDKQLPATFAGISQAITLNSREWKHWFSSNKPEPEEAQLPGEWETKCEDPLRKMIVLRCFRPDRVNFAIKNYIVSNLRSQEFVQSSSASIGDIYNQSSPGIPIILVLSQGVDPTDLLYRFAEDKGADISTISLGKGQSQKAIKFLTEGAADGSWCFLSNCHLSVSLLPELESTLDDIILQGKYKDTFRLFLSASPTEQFPISLLQRSVKMTQEPPRGIKPNMIRLYTNIGQAFIPCEKDQAFRKAVYGLCWFHTLLIERKKFKTLGWNVGYAFNDSDFRVCMERLAHYMGRKNKDDQTAEGFDRKQPVPWQAIQYLIAEANYGGRVTDDRDRRLIKVYAADIFKQDLIHPQERWRPSGSSSQHYQYPADEQNIKNAAEQAGYFTPDVFRQCIQDQMLDQDPPECFGQHTNAEINSQQLDSLELLSSILSLQPTKVSVGGESAEDKSLAEIERLSEQVPQSIDLAALKFKFRKDQDPLNVVLMQEVSRYNALLNVIRQSLYQLERGIKGLDVISPDLEAMMQSFAENKVPAAWSFAYFSLKPLANWMKDLVERYNFFGKWVSEGMHVVFWIGAFTYPTGFTTSLLQRFSRKKDSPSIDRLEFDFTPINRDVKDMVDPPKDGSYIMGLYLEGAKWDYEKGFLVEPEVMELFVQMPIIHFKPIQKRTKPPQNVYECPCYYYPMRQGSVEKDSYMMRIDLRLGEQPAEYWVKRGTALLMSIAT